MFHESPDRLSIMTSSRSAPLRHVVAGCWEQRNTARLERREHDNVGNSVGACVNEVRQDGHPHPSVLVAYSVACYHHHPAHDRSARTSGLCQKYSCTLPFVAARCCPRALQLGSISYICTYVVSNKSVSGHPPDVGDIRRGPVPCCTR
jgi:hypothetical protein